MTHKQNYQRILSFIDTSEDWVTRQEIADAIGVKRADKWEVQLLDDMENAGQIEVRLADAHPVSHLPYYQYRKANRKGRP